MSALAKFLQGKADESLTKLVQPSALVPAAVFVLLNLAFVYPALKADKVGFATAFAGLDETWQVVTVGVLILLLGYLLLSLAGSVLDLLTGESWRDGPLYDKLRSGAQEAVREGRPTTAKRLPDPGRLEALDDAWELRAAYPITGVIRNGPLADDQVKDVGPTRLGNAVRATHAVVFDRYAIDVAGLWPQMEVSADKDSAAMTAVADSKASLDMLANLAFVLAAFGLEALVFFSARGDWSAALLSTLAFPVAYVVYRAAVARARAWGDAVESVFDLSRDELRTGLGLREFTSAADERALWKKTSRLFLWGRDATDEADEVVDGTPSEAKPAVTVTASKNVAVTVAGDDAADVTAERRVARVVDYALVVSQKGDEPVSDAVVVVRDARVLSISRPPALAIVPSDGVATCTIAGSGTGPDSLVIHIPQMGRGAALWIGFSLPIWEALVPEGFTLSGKATPYWTGLDLVVRRADGRGAPTLDVFAGLWAATPWMIRCHAPGGPVERAPTPANGHHRWLLHDDDLGATLRVGFDEETDGEE